MAPLEQSVFERHYPGVGRLWLRRLELERDLGSVHAWVTSEHAEHWGLQGKTPAEVACSYVEILAQADVYLGYREDEPAFLVECYAPERDAVGRCYAVRPGDRGMHLLVAPPERRIAGFTWAVFRAVMAFCFSDAAVERVVVEPDVRNRKIHALNLRAGFRYQDIIELPNKTAHLAFCTRADHAAALERAESERAGRAASPVAHLDAETWAHVNRALVAKALAELAHERVLEPRVVDAAAELWAVDGGGPGLEYRFRARVLELAHWDVDPASILKLVHGVAAPLDALDFVVDLRQQLGLAPDVLPTYLEEIASTLYGAAYKHSHQRFSAADLVHAEFQEIETAMVQGHPSFIANSGRVGFDVSDYEAYAPEAGSAVRLVWLAAHRRHAQFTCSRELSYERLLDEELGAPTVQAWRARLASAGVSPADYVFIPVHPWQWFNRLAQTLAADIARRDLICLGYGADEYRAQQSIRTFFNLSAPHERYVKTALSVLNMGFMRGLSADYMQSTPPINDYVAELVAQDPYFAAQGFGVLREMAAVGYRSPQFEAAVPKSSPYRKMLAALWRESPVGSLAPGERLMTMAALLHRDREGTALLPYLIRASGLGTDEWLDRYLRCYLAPLLHCFYRYDLAFMPHGENIILVLRDHAPCRALLKDIAEEAVVMDAERPLPQAAERLRASVPEDVKLLAIFTDVFDGILRYVAQILHGSGYAEERFWRRVARCLHDYRQAHPELGAKLDRYDLFAPQFRRSCLNRLQLANNQQMIDLTDPAKNLRFAGMLDNPVAAYRDVA